MKKLHYLLISFGIIASVQTGLAQDWEPSAIYGLQQSYLTDKITCLKLEVGGMNYIQADVSYYSNNKIDSIHAIYNPLAEDKEEITTSVVNGNEIVYTIKLRDPDNGVATLSLVKEQYYYTDPSSMLDTMIINKDYDPTNGTLTDIDTIYLAYNSNNQLLSVRYNSNANNYSESFYTGTRLDSIRNYGTPIGPTDVANKGIYNYSGSTLTSIDLYAFEISGLVHASTLNATQNTSNFTTQLTDNTSGVTFKFNQNCSNTTNIKDPKKQTVSIFPNPAKNELFVEGAQFARSPFQIWDVCGRRVLAGEMQSNGIKLGDLKSGIYILEIEGTRVKFIKE